jgi:hypothetical protein
LAWAHHLAGDLAQAAAAAEEALRLDAMNPHTEGKLPENAEQLMQRLRMRYLKQ